MGAAVAATKAATKTWSAVCTAALGLPLLAPTAVHAQATALPESAEVSVKYLAYDDAQPGVDRVKVLATSTLVTVPMQDKWLLNAGYIVDAISGASPAYHASGMVRFNDKRRAGDLELTYVGSEMSLGAGVSLSEESDYIGRGAVVKAATWTDDKNTTFTAGFSVSNDSVEPNNNKVSRQAKQLKSALVGLTQVVSRVDLLQVNLGQSEASGYLSDAYKIYDERPSQRSLRSLALRWNRHFPEWGSTLRTTYRITTDDWKIRTQTYGLEWVLPINDQHTVSPLLRWYTQSAASFYQDAGPPGLPFPPNPPAGAVHYSQDQRLSAFGSASLGVRWVYRLTPKLSLDLKLERAEQHGDWKPGGGSPGLPKFVIRVAQAGLTARF